MLRLIAHSIAAYAALIGALPEPSLTSGTRQEPAAALEFIDTSIENGSPLWYEIVGNVVRINLIYDHERSSPNRAAGHVHFVLHGRPGASLTLEFRNLDNVWNGQPGSVAGELKTVAISDDGKAWRTVPTDSLPGNRVQLRVTMTASRLHVARMEPYRLSDLERLLERIRSHRLVRIESIGHTVSRTSAPDRPRWRSGGGESRLRPRPGASLGSRQQLGRARAHRAFAHRRRGEQALLAQLQRQHPADGERGWGRARRTRFNLRGMDLNRGWDKPADPTLSPENAALERWLEGEIAAGRKPQLALELHNDGNGRLHISRPPVPDLDRYLSRMTMLAELLRRHTWFTEGTTNPEFRNSGTLGEGWLLRYGIDAVVHEFNCNWIEGLKEPTSGTHWRAYGAALARVFHAVTSRE